VRSRERDSRAEDDLADSTPAPRPPTRRVRKRILIPTILLALLVGLFAFLYYRGTAADTVERNPQSAGEGPVTQLYRNPAGQTAVRCAVVIDHPPEEVWRVITDYEHHPTFMPYVTGHVVSKDPDGRIHVSGTAHSRIWGDWRFESRVTHDEKPEKGEYTASWDESGADLAVNRGSWTIRPADGGKALLAFTLEVEAGRSPKFLIRNVLMDRLPAVLRAVRDEVNRRKQSPHA
jgi:uncharacterized protein YndB with AHSA1/START domain